MLEVKQNDGGPIAYMPTLMETPKTLFGEGWGGWPFAGIKKCLLPTTMELDLLGLKFNEVGIQEALL